MVVLNGCILVQRGHAPQLTNLAVKELVPRHGDFDWLGQSNSGRCLGINEQFNAARDPGLPPDEAGAFQG